MESSCIEVGLLNKIKSSLSSKEIKRIDKLKNRDNMIQKAHSYYLIKKLLKEKKPKNISIDYRKSGRPYIKNRNLDISISHKSEKVFVGIVKSPYKIGVDLEKFDVIKNIEIFQKYFLCDKEKDYIKNYCKENRLSLSEALIIFWSIKESFFKCIDYYFIPKLIKIRRIDGKNVDVICSEKIIKKMERKKLYTKEIKVKYDKNFVYVRTLMGR
tara:strand:+ start:280 stop:918 length:639 start_codon:yes stop_codon:yes gene_type:complete